jgi:hypothetical protein
MNALLMRAALRLQGRRRLVLSGVVALSSSALFSCARPTPCQHDQDCSPLVCAAREGRCVAPHRDDPLPVVEAPMPPRLRGALVVGEGAAAGARFSIDAALRAAPMAGVTRAVR